jgi:hypothetical protein
LRLDALCNIRELSSNLINNREFIEKIKSENGNLSLRKVAELFSENMGIPLNAGPLDLEGEFGKHVDIEFSESSKSLECILLSLIPLFSNIEMSVEQNVVHGGNRKKVLSGGGGIVSKLVLGLAALSVAQSTNGVSSNLVSSQPGGIALSGIEVSGRPEAAGKALSSVEVTVGPPAIFVYGPTGTETKQVNNITYYLAIIEDRFLPAAGQAVNDNTHVNFLAGLQKAFSGVKSQYDLGLATNVIKSSDIAQANVLNSVISWGSNFIGLNGDLPEGVALVEFVEKKVPGLRGGLSGLMNNPESAGIIPISELASLKTLLQSSQFKSNGIKFYQDKNDETIVEIMRRAYPQNNKKQVLDDIRTFSGFQIDSIITDISKGKYSIGSVAVITRKTPLSDRIREFYGAKDTASDLSIEPMKIFISVIKPINYETQQSAFRLATETHQSGIDALANHDKDFNVFLDEFHNLVESVKKLENQCENIRTGVGVTRSAVEIQHSSLSFSISLIGGVATAIAGELNPSPTRKVVEAVEGESSQDKTTREGKYLSTLKLFQEETGKELDDLGAASITETVKRVLLLAATKVSRDTSPPVVIICGTGFILPEARQAIGIIEPVDDCV